MPFGTDNLQYGNDLGGSTTDWTSTGEGSVYDEYVGDSYISADLDVADYLYTYDPLKEQNLLADYMSGLADLGDKTEGVRTKAIAERKALSKSIRGGLTSGTMESMEEKGMEDASKAQAGLYRNQASAKRGLGENIGSLREAYEADVAQGVESYNSEVQSGTTVNEQLLLDADERERRDNWNGSPSEYNYRRAVGLDTDSSGTGAFGSHKIYGNLDYTNGEPKEFWDTSHGDTAFNQQDNQSWIYKDPDGMLGLGYWSKTTY